MDRGARLAVPSRVVPIDARLLDLLAIGGPFAVGVGLTAIAFFKGWLWPGPLAERERTRADAATAELAAERALHGRFVAVIRELTKEVRGKG